MKIQRWRRALFLALIPLVNVGACAPAASDACQLGNHDARPKEISEFLEVAFGESKDPLHFFDREFLQDYYSDISPSPVEYLRTSDGTPTSRRVATSTIYHGDRDAMMWLEVGAYATTSSWRPFFAGFLGTDDDFFQSVRSNEVQGENWAAVFSFHHLNEGDDLQAVYANTIQQNPDIFDGKLVLKRETSTCVLGVVIDQGHVVAATGAFAPLLGSNQRRHRWDYAACREAYYATVIGLRNFPIPEVRWPDPELKIHRPIPIGLPVWSEEATREIVLASEGSTPSQLCQDLFPAFDAGL